MKSPIQYYRTLGLRKVLTLLVLLLSPAILQAPETSPIPSFASIRVEFILFGLTLACVAFFHKQTMIVAITGMVVIMTFKLIFDPGFQLYEHFLGGAGKEGEWRVLLNLMGLLFGFAILSRHFEQSKAPDALLRFLPRDWKGGLMLLFMIMFISSFIDNIAAALIGGSIAKVIFKGKLHLGYLAAIVAASNAGGAGSVVGDTTTTLMWIDGVNPLWVLHAFVASAAAFCIFGVFGSLQQARVQPIIKSQVKSDQIDKGKILIVVLILAGAILTNYLFGFPALGVWIVLLIGSFFRKTSWNEIGNSWKGTVFLLSLVTCASLMPVEELPPASWHSAFVLGFVSAVFDNIPLTKICLDQGGYDWGIVSFAVGFGGSMIWFGSSAGVALSNMFPELKHTVNYLKKGWHVTVAYIIGFFIMLGVVGWNPHPAHKQPDSKLSCKPLIFPPAASPSDKPLHTLTKGIDMDRERY